MTLKSQMAADVDAVFLSTSDFGAAATFYPGTSPTGFAIVVVLADVDEQFASVSSGTALQRRARASLSRAVVRAGIATLEETARDADRGDSVSVATVGDPFFGVWYVESAVADVGGMLTLGLRLDSRYEAAGTGAVLTGG